jgi:hypothetical protein
VVNFNRRKCRKAIALEKDAGIPLTIAYICNGKNEVIGLSALYFRNRLKYFCKAIVLDILCTLVIGWRIAIAVVDKIKRVDIAIDIID